MNLPFLQQKLTRVLTHPPELLYVVSRHWFILCFFLVLGTAAGWLFVVSRAPVYEGRARLIVTPSQGADTESPAAAIPASRMRHNEVERFLATHASIVSSDAVLRAFLGRLMDSALSGGGSGNPGNGDSEPSSAKDSRRFVREAKQRVKEFLQLSDGEALTEDERLQYAVSAFRRSSSVQADASTHSIVVRVYNSDPDWIVKALQSWVEAYKTRVDEMELRSWESITRSRAKAYRELLKSAEEELTRFRKEHPTVTDSRLDDLTQQLARHRIVRDDLWSRLQLGTETPEEDPLREKVDPELTELRRELARKRSEGVTEESREVRQLVKAIAALEAGQEGRTLVPDGLEERRLEEHRQQLEEKYESLTGKLEALYVEHSALKEKLKRLHRLEEEHQQALARLKSVESLTIIEPDEPVLIQLADGPTVGAEPYEYHPLRNIALGSFLGIAFGGTLALLAEVLCGKVRFKHDVTEDCGLPVVAVFPK